MAYLSEPEAGGRTIFPQLGLTVKPEVRSQTKKIGIYHMLLDLDIENQHNLNLD